jgi:hypothetical protein
MLKMQKSLGVPSKSPAKKPKKIKRRGWLLLLHEVLYE